jgi:RNA recognition motif-containing protein
MTEVESDKYTDNLVNVHLPKDRISMAHQGYGFCEFLTEEDAEYACKIMNQIKLWGKPIRVNKVRCRLSRIPPITLKDQI